VTSLELWRSWFEITTKVEMTCGTAVRTKGAHLSPQGAAFYDSEYFLFSVIEAPSPWSSAMLATYISARLTSLFRSITSHLGDAVVTAKLHKISDLAKIVPSGQYHCIYRANPRCSTRFEPVG
jgi:hypothetical protein